MIGKTRLLALLLMPILTLACSGQGSKTTSRTPSPRPTALVTATAPISQSSPAPATESPTPPARAQRLITGADDNHTLVVQVGTILVLALDASFDWSGFTVSNPSVLRPYVVATPQAGSQGSYYAARAGEATLSATGTVHCQPNVPCPQLARLFRVTIRVGL